MSKFLRLAGVVLCVGVLALGVVAFHFACPRTNPPSQNPNLKSSMAEEVARHEQLAQMMDAIRRRWETKRQVVEEVIAQRCSLAEAIEQFRALDRQWPDLRSGITKAEALWMSEDEWGGWAVIAQVRQVLADLPDEADAVAGRLEEELRELLADRKKRRSTPSDLRTEQRSHAEHGN
jgi:hypothetical protein